MHYRFALHSQSNLVDRGCCIHFIILVRIFILPWAPRTASLWGDNMATGRPKVESIDEYVSLFSPEVQAILRKIRLTIKEAAPAAQETISYGIPAFKLAGALVYFSASKKHIGFYPPVRGDEGLEKAVSKYAGEKGSLRFPLDDPIPYNLIKRIVKFRVQQNKAKAEKSGTGGSRTKAVKNDRRLARR